MGPVDSTGLRRWSTDSRRDRSTTQTGLLHNSVLSDPRSDTNHFPPQEPFSMATVIAAPPSTPLFHHNQAMHPNTPHQYTYPSSAQPFPRPPTYIQPTLQRSRRPTDVVPIHPPHMHSLPSIHEALGRDNHFPYPPPHSNRPPQQPSSVPAISQQSPQQVNSQPPYTSNTIIGPSGEGPSGPSNPFSSTGPSSSAPASFYQENNTLGPTIKSEGSARSQESMNRTGHSFGSAKSSSRSSVISHDFPAPLSSSSSGPPTAVSVVTNPASAPSTAISSPITFVQGYPHPLPSQSQQAAPPITAINHSARSWNHSGPGPSSIDTKKRAMSLSVSHDSDVDRHRDLVNKHIDNFDIRKSLDEAREASIRSLELLSLQSNQSLPTSRPPSTTSNSTTLSSIPSLQEIDEMIRLHKQATDMLERSRSLMISQKTSPCPIPIYLSDSKPSMVAKRRAVATAAIVMKPQNGEEGLMERALCAMLVGCTMQKFSAKKRMRGEPQAEEEEGPCNMSIIIRPATKDDIPAIHEIYTHYTKNTVLTFLQHPPPLQSTMDKFLTSKSRNLPFLVAVETDPNSTPEEKICGYASGSPFRGYMLAYSPTVELSIFLRPECQSRGIGSRLLDEIISSLREMLHYAVERDIKADERQLADMDGGVKVRNVVAIMAVDQQAKGAGVALRDWYVSKGFVECGTIKQAGYKLGRW
ncbi:hypothetical protein FQN57_005739 [Myotisia sp. PD_48]|nr:hypothetical protein FQN57_005739 [Myotisia sp. PD_48]